MLGIDSEGVGREVWRLFQIIGIVKGFAVGTEVDLVHPLAFFEVTFKPWQVLEILLLLGAPCHRAKQAILNDVNGVSVVHPLRRKAGDFGAVALQSQIHPRLRRPQDFQFIDGDIGLEKSQSNGLGLNSRKMPGSVGGPVFFPGSEVAQRITRLLERVLKAQSLLLSGILCGPLNLAASKFDILEHRTHGVIVLEGDGIKFVGVASGALHGDPKHGSPDGLHDFIHAICPCLTNGTGLSSHSGCGDMRAGHEKSGGSPCAQYIPCHLFGDELVVGLVLIEGLDHIVSIQPRAFSIEIGFRSIGFRPADDIEPMLSPALPIMR